MEGRSCVIGIGGPLMSSYDGRGGMLAGYINYSEL